MINFNFSTDCLCLLTVNISTLKYSMDPSRYRYFINYIRTYVRLNRIHKCLHDLTEDIRTYRCVNQFARKRRACQRTYVFDFEDLDFMNKICMCVLVSVYTYE